MKPKLGPYRVLRHVPNTLSILNLLLGVWAIISAVHGWWGMSMLALLLGILFDGWDGRIARRLGTLNPLGKDLDSLADLVSSGVAPALLVFFAMHSPSIVDTMPSWLASARVGIIHLPTLFIAAAFITAAAIRLAIYNTSDTSTVFYGMPTTAANGVITTTITLPWLPLSFWDISMSGEPWGGWHYDPVWVLALLLILAAAMVLRIPYPKPGRITLRVAWIPLGVVGMGIMVFFSYTVHAIFLAYGVLAPLWWLYRARGRRQDIGINV